MQVNVWKIIYLNCGERYEDINYYRCGIQNLNSCEIIECKRTGLNGIPTRDLCDTGGVPYQLSFCPLKPEFCSFFNILLSSYIFLRSSNIWSLIYSLACTIKFNKSIHMTKTRNLELNPYKSEAKRWKQFSVLLMTKEDKGSNAMV